MPDKTIALSFFQLAPLNESANPEVHAEQLKKTSEIFSEIRTSFLPIKLSESRVTLYGSIEKRGDYYLGTLIRNQISSIPPSYDESSSELSQLPLTDNQGLAYQTSFLYYPTDRIVMIESIKNGVGVSTLCDFLNKNYNIDHVEPLIVINPSKLEEYYNMTYISRFSVRISKLEHGTIYKTNKKTAVGKMMDVADDTNSNTLEYTLIAKRKTGSLKRAKITGMLRTLLKHKDDEVKKLIISGKEDDDGSNETIDFIEHKLQDNITVQRQRLIGSFEINDHYEKLIAVFNVHKPSLRSYAVRNK